MSSDSLFQTTFVVSPPWLLMVFPGKPVIRIDAGLLDDISVDDAYVCLAVGEIEARLLVGEENARSLVDELLKYTRGSPISDLRVYEDARLRLREYESSARSICNGAFGGIFVGSKVVTCSDGRLHVGATSIEVQEVARLARDYQILQLSEDATLQAALACLIIEAEKRFPSYEARILQRRLQEYERMYRN